MAVTTDPAWLELEGMPAIAGLRARRFREDADFGRIAEVMTASNAFDGVPWVPTADLIRLELDENPSQVDKTRDQVIVEVDGETVAEASSWRVMRDGHVVFEVGGHVAPACRRRGIGRALLQENIRRSVERAASEAADAIVELGAFADEAETGARAILDDAGFETVRYFFLMRRPELATVERLPLPDGLELRPVTVAQHRAIFDAEAEAFRDHWGHREMTDEDFRTMFGHAELDTSLWVVAWEGDEIAGVVEPWIWLTENERLGVSRGWLERISVRRPWRRRGLARALTAEGMIRLRERGMADAMLGVDAENPTGALGLYESLGFAVDRTMQAYRRPLVRPG